LLLLLLSRQPCFRQKHHKQKANCCCTKSPGAALPQPSSLKMCPACAVSCLRQRRLKSHHAATTRSTGHAYVQLQHCRPQLPETTAASTDFKPT
jgi:hypothetical protein